MPNFWVTAGAQHLRTLAHSLPKGAESAPHRGGNAREKTSKRFHFYSPTSAAGTRGVYHVPTTTFLPRRGCINLRQKRILTWNSFDVQNTFQRQQPHVRHRRTWGYRGATSPTWQTLLRNLSFPCVFSFPTWQTPLRNLSFACVFPLRRGKLRALTFLYLGGNAPVAIKMKKG